MSSTLPASGSAQRHGALWGARAEAWAENEEQQRPTYAEAIDRVGIHAGTAVLELGCGSGVFLRMAADRGARVVGLDAAEPLIELARERVPEADLRVGDIQFLPYEDDSFDVVAGFNSFFFAADMVAALKEAGRVAKAGAPVVIQVWGRPERCDLTAMKRAVLPLGPPPPEGAPEPPPLWKPGVLEGLAAEAGLTPQGAFDITYAFEHPDEDSMVRRTLAPGLIVEAIHRSGEQRVRAAIVESLEPYRTPGGGYRLTNEWHCVIASA